MERRPLASVALGLLLGLGGAASLGGVLSAAQLDALSLQAHLVASGEQLFRLVSFWPFWRDPMQLLAALVPLGLFAVPVERRAGPWRVLLAFGLGVLVSGAVFVWLFAGMRGQIVGGAGGGAALAAAAVILSWRGRVLGGQGNMPLWVVGLLFLGGVAWLGAAGTPQAPVEAALYRLSGALPGLGLGLWWLRALPRAVDPTALPEDES